MPDEKSQDTFVYQRTMKLIPDIQSRFKDLEQEELYLLTAHQLGSKLNELGTYAVVTNQKAHQINMKVFNYLEKYQTNQMEWTRILRDNIKRKMKAQSETHKLENLGI